MPHRLLENPLGAIIEAVMLGILLGYEIAKNAVIAFSEQDWSRFMGPQGFTVGLLLAVVVLWGNGMASEPAAPAANGFIIYAIDNGSGKTRLMVKFATGAAQQLAIEP